MAPSSGGTEPDGSFAEEIARLTHDDHLLEEIPSTPSPLNPQDLAQAVERHLVREAEESAAGIAHLSVVHGDPETQDDIERLTTLSRRFDELTEGRRRRVAGGSHYTTYAVGPPDADQIIAQLAERADQLGGADWLITRSDRPPTSLYGPASLVNLDPSRPDQRPRRDASARGDLGRPSQSSRRSHTVTGEVAGSGQQTKVCDNASVGIIIKGHDGRYLFFDRKTFPPGTASAAGHVFDEHSGYRDAAAAEVNEELGLTVETLTLLSGGWRGNKCRRRPGPRGVGHQWEIYLAEVSGELNPSTRKTKNVRWLTQSQLQKLTDRTVAYADGRVTDAQFTAQPGIEPVWVQWLADAGLITASPEALAKIDVVASRGHGPHRSPGGGNDSFAG
jgi:hypothetical protein